MSAPQSLVWFDRGSEDLIVARLVKTEGHYSHACFLAHQCIEKVLKAFLIHTINQYPRTHGLVNLVQRCAEIYPGFSDFRDGCTIVDLYYIPTRYPNGLPGSLPNGLPGQKDSSEAIAIAERIHSFVERQLRTELSESIHS